MGLFGDVSAAVFWDVIRRLFGERRVVVVNLNPRELLVIAREVMI
jgi:hypothetical protein